MRKVVLLSMLAVLVTGCNLNKQEEPVTQEYVYAYDDIDYSNLYVTDSLVTIKAPKKNFSKDKLSTNCDKAIKENNSKKKGKTFSSCLRAARNGDPQYQLAVSEFYRTGEGVSKNNYNSFYWSEKAARAGNAEAQALVGYKYLEGIGTRRNNELGIFWLTKAAEQGNVSAAYSLGLFYADGSHGVVKDLGRSYKWHIRAATWGLPIAQASIAQKTSKGEGVPSDKVEGVAWAMVVDNCTTDKTQNDELVSELSLGLTTIQLKQAKLSSDNLFKKYSCDRFVTFIVN